MRQFAFNVQQRYIYLPNGIRLILDIDASDVQSELSGLAESIAGDWRPLYNKWANMMRGSFRKNFERGGRPDRWAPLSPNTLIQKAMVGAQNGLIYASRRGRRRISRLAQFDPATGEMARTTANILIATGKLRDSYVQKGQDHVERINSDGLEIGSKSAIASVHEFGGKGSYIIRPRKGSRLRFRTVRGIVLAKSVIHPPMIARPVAVIQKEDQKQILDDIRGRLEEPL